MILRIHKIGKGEIYYNLHNNKIATNRCVVIAKEKLKVKIASRKFKYYKRS